MAGKVKQLTFAEGVSITAPTEVDLVDTVNAQTVGGAKKFTSAITIAEIATPATPASGYKSVYPKTDGKMYTLDSTGAEVAVGTGGAGGRNYLADWYDGTKLVGTVTNSITATGNITISTTLWQASDTSKLTVANLTSGGLRETKSLKLDSIGAGAAFVQSPCFLLDTMDLGKPITTTFDLSSVVTSDDYQVVIVRYNSSGTYQEQIVIAGTASATTPFSARLLTGTANNQGFFIASSTSTDYYALRFVRNSASDTTDILFDSLYVGPQSVVQGAAVTDWVSCTMVSTGFGTTTLDSCWKKQIGDSIHYRGYFKAGTVSANNAGIGLPTGDVIDSTKFASTTSAQLVGQVRQIRTAVGPSTDIVIQVFYDGSTTGSVFFSYQDGSNVFTKVLGNALISNSDGVSFEFSLPIVGKSSNVTMANRAVSESAYNTSSTTANDTTSFGYGLVGSQIRSFAPAGNVTIDKRVQFQTPIQKNSVIELKVSKDSGATWMNVTDSGLTQQYNEAGTAAVGMRWAPVSSTTIDVNFHSKANFLQNWSVYDSTTYLWRVDKTDGGASVGFPIGARNVVGDTTGTTVPTGYIGETIEAALTTTASTTSEADVTGASLALTPGKWEITYSVTTTVVTGAVASNDSTLRLCITDSANTHVGRSERQLSVKTVAAIANSVDTALSASCIVNISAATTYKLRLRRFDNAGTGTASVYASTGNFDSVFYAKRIG